jgi:hypothetical protein
MVKKGTGRHRPSSYKKHKVTKHRTLEVPEGFEFVKAERHPEEPKRLRVVFKKKR